jgi:hypothetical protein
VEASPPVRRRRTWTIYRKMRKYHIELRGTRSEKVMFSIGFTIGCLTGVFIPIAILALIQNIEIIEVR